jgi:Outer membrane protein beta-barrel domain
MCTVQRLFALPLLVLGLVSNAAAQDGGPRISGFFAGAFGEGETNVAAGGAAGYRFTPRVGFEFEAFALPDLQFDDTRDSGRGVAFLTNFVSEFPSPARWLTPYVQGGGGVANISQSGVLALARGRNPLPVDPRGLVGRLVGRPTLENDMRVADFGRRPNETAVALSFGGGVDFTVWRGLALGPNLAYLKLFGNLADRDLTRIGVRTSYRF